MGIFPNDSGIQIFHRSETSLNIRSSLYQSTLGTTYFKLSPKFNILICFTIFLIFSDRGTHFSTSFPRPACPRGKLFHNTAPFLSFLFFWMRNFLPPPHPSLPFLRSLHRFHSPFSVPVAIVNRFTAASNRKPAVDQLSASIDERTRFRGQTSMVHRLFVATFPLATGYFIISLRCGKLTPLAVHPLFNVVSVFLTLWIDTWKEPWSSSFRNIYLDVS